MPTPRRSTFRSPSRRRSAWRAVSATLLAVVAVLGGLTACEPPPETTLGIFLPFQTCCVGGPEIIREARALGVRTVRFSQNVTQPVRATFRVFERSGMRVVLSAINDPQPDGLGHNPGRPPENLARYRQQLGAVLDGMADPVLVQIENEENARNFYVGTMAEYVEQLDVAIEVAHERGLKITNGGITNKPLQLLVWQDYRDRGLEAAADDFAARVFSAPADQWILRDLRARPFTGLSRQPLQDAWDRAKALIPAFAANAMDYVNFHWYTDDHEALAEAVRYLRRVIGKDVVTTEIGQHNTSPDVVTGHLDTVVGDLHLPLVIWFDADGIPAYGLHDEPGVLRANGEVFKRWVNAHPELVQ